MIPGADRITVAPVGHVAAAAGADAVGDARQQDFQRALAGLVGKSMPAEVLSRLTDGSLIVRVAGIPARMVLPSPPPQPQLQSLQPGAEIALTLVSLTPRPTFQLTNAPQLAAIPAFFDVDAPAGAQRHATALESAASEATLSATARVLSNVLGAAARAEHPQTSIVAPLALLAQAPADPARLAAQLKDAIGTSGLFYESHLAEWSAGTRALAELQREPQMQRELPMQREPQLQRGLTADSAADPAAAQFINLQLASQEQGRIAWQGQLLPGQDLAWQISRDRPGSGAHAGAENPDPPWRSALRLRFAALGEIGATVVLAGDQLHIALQAGSGDIGSVLRARSDELRRALEACGNPAATLTVSLAAPSGATAGQPGHDHD